MRFYTSFLYVKILWLIDMKFIFSFKLNWLHLKYGIVHYWICLVSNDIIFIKLTFNKNLFRNPIMHIVLRIFLWLKHQIFLSVYMHAHHTQFSTTSLLITQRFMSHIFWYIILEFFIFFPLSTVLFCFLLA